MKRGFTEEDDRILIENYGKISYKEIGLLLTGGRTPGSLNQRLDRLGIRLPGIGKSILSKPKRTLNVNDNFFSVPNKINAYWAGFIAADGNIAKDRPLLTINLADKDVEHLRKFKEDIGAENIVHIGANGMCHLYIISKSIADDLKLHWNIIPNKSLVLRPPNIADPALLQAFVAGVIDGDGSIGIYKQSYSDNRILKMSVASGSEKFALFLLNYFKSLIGGEKIGFHKIKNSNTIVVSTTGNKARTILKKLSDDELPLLKRKWGVIDCLPNTIEVGHTMFGVKRKSPPGRVRKIPEEIS